MDINNLTIGQAKELVSLFGKNNTGGLDSFGLGGEVIIRTYSAGVWFGTLSQKEGKEVVLKNARRLWQWKCAESISLSGVVAYGIDQKESKITPAIDSVWLEAIEIMPIAGLAARSIREAENVSAE